MCRNYYTKRERGPPPQRERERVWRVCPRSDVRAAHSRAQLRAPACASRASSAHVESISVAERRTEPAGEEAVQDKGGFFFSRHTQKFKCVSSSGIWATARGAPEKKIARRPRRTSTPGCTTPRARPPPPASAWAVAARGVRTTSQPPRPSRRTVCSPSPFIPFLPGHSHITHRHHTLL